MRNPYDEDGIAHSEFALGRGAACAVIAAFILILLLPPLYRNVYEAAAGGEESWVPVAEIFKPQGQRPDGEAYYQPITEHLKTFEHDLEDRADFAEPPRRLVQGTLARLLREGNRKTFIGRDGWLFLKPAIDSLSGYGPITAEPDSVAKDPNRAPWRAPLGAIETFAAQLDEFGIELLLVPIPVKPMIYPEHIAGGEFGGPLTHRDAAAFYREIEALPNASVLDLSEAFWAAKADHQLFLKQDTHWTPAGMALAAGRLAERISGRAKPGPLAAGPPVEVSNIGDLVEQLNLPGGGRGQFRPEVAETSPVFGFAPDPTSEITLLGDSFTNIYSAETLGWGEGAGFAQHLALALQHPLDVIAKNGQASTGVRAEFAARGRAHLAKKKLVIWAIAARDLFLSETAARENNVTWDDVSIPDIADAATQPAANLAPAESLQITAKLIMKSAIKDPSSVTYKNAIFLCEYQVEEIHSGSYEGETILVKDWAFQDKQLTPASRRQPGDRVDLHLVPFDTKTKLQNEQEFNDIDAEDIDKLTMVPYWSEPVAAEASAEGEVLEAVPGGGHKPRAIAAASIACVLASISVVALARRLARRGAA